MEFLRFELKNGIRVAFNPSEGSDIVHFALTVGAGTRDENEDENGIAHFIEHCLFKGTKKRKAFHILSRLDAVGGELNAYTTKEETCIYASFESRYTERAFELISDILFHSAFPEKEINKEKTVVIDEIQSYQDSPSELIFDEFEEVVYGKHPLGHSILGTEESVNSFTRKKLTDFIKRNYHSSRIILSASGNISIESIKKYSEKYFSFPVDGKNPVVRKRPSPGKSKRVEKKYDTFQDHTLIGGRAYSYHHKLRPGLVLMNNMFGGPAMNSRLNLALRERHGYAYNVESSFSPYMDTGIISVYFGTDTKNTSKCTELVMKEIARLKKEKLSSSQLNQSRQQLKGQIALSEENRVNRTLAMGKSILVFDKIFSIGEVFEKIDRITSEQIRDIANEIFEESNLSFLSYKSR
jgi:predicted Zn-dependent peptidase